MPCKEIPGWLPSNQPAGWASCAVCLRGEDAPVTAISDIQPHPHRGLLPRRNLLRPAVGFLSGSDDPEQGRRSRPVLPLPLVQKQFFKWAYQHYRARAFPRTTCGKNRTGFQDCLSLLPNFTSTNFVYWSYGLTRIDRAYTCVHFTCGSIQNEVTFIFSWYNSAFFLDPDLTAASLGIFPSTHVNLVLTLVFSFSSTHSFPLPLSKLRHHVDFLSHTPHG